MTEKLGDVSAGVVMLVSRHPGHGSDHGSRLAAAEQHGDDDLSRFVVGGERLGLAGSCHLDRARIQ